MTGRQNRNAWPNALMNGGSWYPISAGLPRVSERTRARERERELERESESVSQSVVLYLFSLSVYHHPSAHHVAFPTPPLPRLLRLGECGTSTSLPPPCLPPLRFVSGPPGRRLPPWAPRGTAEIRPPHLAIYSPAPSVHDGLSLHPSDPLALYQVALELPGVSPDLWPFSSVKAVCTHISVSPPPWENTQRLKVSDSACTQVPPHR
jgi:hypothetical protein